jgi:serine/threonine protein kinase/tetratricopeptide (TPR) repeat protein
MRYPFEERPEWVLVRGLGEGTMGPSFLVEGTTPPVEQAVIKVVTPLQQLPADRLKLEIEALGRLKHPGLVSWRGVIREGDQVGLARQYVVGAGILEWVTLAREDEGGLEESSADSSQDDLLTLESRRVSRELEGLSEDTDEIGAIVAEMAARERALRRATLEEILGRLAGLMPSLLDALEHLHRYRKVHGGLHAQNILVSPQGACLLTDFGLWPMVEGIDQADRIERAPSSARIIALRSQAPETHKAGGGFVLASDVYSLGCVIYELLAGKPPFEGSAQEIIEGHLQEAVPSLLEACPGCPSAWAELVDSMLTKHPDRRATLPQIREQLARCPTRPTSVPPTYLPAPAKLCGRFEVVDAIMAGAHEVMEQERLKAIVVEGDSGLGKNHLSEQACWRLAQRGWVVLRSTCYADESTPFQSWQGLASGLGELLDRCPAAMQQRIKAEREVAASMLPGLMPTGQAPVATTLQRARALRALQFLLARIAEERPVVLCLENAHLASRDSQELLLDLCAWRGELRCLVLSTWGPGHARKQEIMGAERVEVPSMTREEARRFLRSFAQGDALEALEPLITLREHHQPLVLKELLYELHRAGDEKQRANLLGDLTRPDHDGSAQASRTRAALKRAFQDRVARLGEVELLLLQAIGVHPGPLGLDILRKLPAALGSAQQGSETPEGLMARLCMMRMAKRLQARRGVLPSYRISHEICRKVVLASVEEPRRKALLVAIAEAVPEGPDRAGRRFALLAAAGEDTAAMEVAEEALYVARARLAFAQAATIRRWVLERSGSGDGLGAQLQELARLEAASGRFHEAAELWSQCAQAGGGPAQVAGFWLEEGRMWLRSGEFKDSREALERAELLLEGHLHGSGAGRVVAMARTRFSGPGARQRALRGQEAKLSVEVQTESRLEALALRLDPLVSGALGARRREELEVLGWEHHSPALLARAWGMGLERLLERDFERAREEGAAVLDEIISYHQAQRDGAGTLFGLTLKARLSHQLGEYSAAAATYRVAREAAAEVTAADQIERAELYFWRATYYLDAGRLAEVEVAIEQLMHEERHLVMASLYGHRLAVKLRMTQGRLTEAARHLETLREVLGAEGMGGLWGAWVVRHEARMQIALGRPEVASGLLDLGWEALEESGLARWPLVALQHQLVLAQALVTQAERERALREDRLIGTTQRLRRAVRAVVRGIDSAPPLLAAEALRLIARHELLRGRQSRALRALEHAAQRMGHVPSPVAEACCLEARGLVLQELEREEGRGLIQQARQVFGHYRAVAPLILEGWPAPRELISLRDERDPA